jgi:hypothetical protein
MVKTRYNLFLGKPMRASGFGLFPWAWGFMPKSAIGRAKFRAYMLLTHP